MVNLVILVRDRFLLTEQCLKSLFAHTDPGMYNLTVVNDGSVEFKVTRLLRQIDAPNVSVLDVSNSGHVLAQLKNTGVAYSEQRFGRGDWLYIGDSDTYFMPGALGKLTCAAMAGEYHGFSLLGGQVHPFHHPINGVFIGTGVDGYNLHEYGVLDGPSWLMRWKTWDKVGPLSRACASGTGQSEDVEWCGRLVALDGRIGVIQRHVVVHTGLTNTAGYDVPGKTELLARVPLGVVAQ